jgi:hypothetical protein
MTAETDVNLNGNTPTDSDDNISFISEDTIPGSGFEWFDEPINSTDIVDAEIVEGSRLKSEPATGLNREAKSGIPNIDEWMYFFSKVVLRLSTDFYIDHAFRGIDEEQLTEREVEKIKLTDTERNRMARPFAEYANKAKFTRKHGRVIIASADSIDAILQMGMWFSRVNRIAAKYKGTRSVKTSRPQPVRASPVFRPEPKLPDFDDRSDDVSSRQSAPHGDGWRPDIAGPVFNPAGGG